MSSFSTHVNLSMENILAVQVVVIDCILVTSRHIVKIDRTLSSVECTLQGPVITHTIHYGWIPMHIDRRLEIEMI